jgi:hypothetical protein
MLVPKLYIIAAQRQRKALRAPVALNGPAIVAGSIRECPRYWKALKNYRGERQVKLRLTVDVSAYLLENIPLGLFTPPFFRTR